MIRRSTVLAFAGYRNLRPVPTDACRPSEKAAPPVSELLALLRQRGVDAVHAGVDLAEAEGHFRREKLHRRPQKRLEFRGMSHAL